MRRHERPELTAGDIPLFYEPEVRPLAAITDERPDAYRWLRDEPSVLVVAPRPEEA